MHINLYDFTDHEAMDEQICAVASVQEETKCGNIKIITPL
jgi:hypothetical protein